MIANDVFPEAVDWFTGKAAEAAMDISDDEDSEVDEEDDDDAEESDASDDRYRIPETRSAASSTASIEVEERLEALNRLNQDLARKLVEAERTLQTRLSDHEQELEEMQVRLEDAKVELSATRREEKELRSKEVCNIGLEGLSNCSLRMTAPKYHANCGP